MEMVQKKTSRKIRASWSSIAFVVESILLLVFLVASMALLTRLYASSLSNSVESRSLDAAAIAATSIAEHFSADPTGVEQTTRLGDLVIRCDVTADQRAFGTMYHAQINVYDLASADGGSPIYTLDTARYEHGVA